MTVSRDLFRAISSSFPTGVLIVTTLDEGGAPRGLTTQAYMGLSTEPPLMLVAIDKKSRTLSALQKSRAFVINFLKQGAEDISTTSQASVPTGKDVEKGTMAENLTTYRR